MPDTFKNISFCFYRSFIEGVGKRIENVRKRFGVDLGDPVPRGKSTMKLLEIGTLKMVKVVGKVKQFRFTMQECAEKM